MREAERLIKSFACATAGIINTVMTQRNMRIHICAVVYVVLFGAMQRLDAVSWTIEIICCAAVIALELVNTAVENACNAVTHEIRSEIKMCKDASAGAVLVMAAASVLIWGLILVRGSGGVFLVNLKDAFVSGWGCAAAAVWLVLSFIFIFYRKKK